MSTTGSWIIRILLMLAAVLLFVPCILPFYLRRIINVGNGSGVALSLIVFLYALFMPQVNKFLSVLWKNKAGKTVLCALILLMAAGIVIVITESALMYKAAKKAPPANATVVILGCRVYGTRPSIMLQTRLDAALEYLLANPDSACILSGGKGDDEPISESECMYGYLIEKGIAPERLYIENRSTSTRENLFRFP